MDGQVANGGIAYWRENGRKGGRDGGIIEREGREGEGRQEKGRGEGRQMKVKEGREEK